MVKYYENAAGINDELTLRDQLSGPTLEAFDSAIEQGFTEEEAIESADILVSFLPEDKEKDFLFGDFMIAPHDTPLLAGIERSRAVHVLHEWMLNTPFGDTIRLGNETQIFAHTAQGVNPGALPHTMNHAAMSVQRQIQDALLGLGGSAQPEGGVGPVRKMKSFYDFDIYKTDSLENAAMNIYEAGGNPSHLYLSPRDMVGLKKKFMKNSGKHAIPSMPSAIQTSFGTVNIIPVHSMEDGKALLMDASKQHVAVLRPLTAKAIQKSQMIMTAECTLMCTPYLVAEVTL